MGMFAKKTQTVTKQLYTLDSAKTVLIVGLGNPGKKYADTRHNLGFMCLDYFAPEHQFPAWSKSKAFKCSLSEHNLDSRRVILAKPDTFMNNSGQAVRALAQFYEIAPTDIMVIHDDLDMAFGQIRTRIGGGSGGHNGLKSLIENIGEDFGRVRIGVSNEHAVKTDSAKFVLAKFNASEKKQITALKKEVAAILNEYIFGGALPIETRSFLVE